MKVARTTARVYLNLCILLLSPLQPNNGRSDTHLLDVSTMDVSQTEHTPSTCAQEDKPQTPCRNRSLSVQQTRLRRSTRHAADGWLHQWQHTVRRPRTPSRCVGSICPRSSSQDCTDATTITPPHEELHKFGATHASWRPIHIAVFSVVERCIPVDANASMRPTQHGHCDQDMVCRAAQFVRINGSLHHPVAHAQRCCQHP